MLNETSIFEVSKRESDKGKTPKLLSPIRSYEGAVRVVNAGADELYCGVIVPEMRDFVLYRGPKTDIPTYNELGQVVRYAHDHHVSVGVTVNNPFMTEKMEVPLRKHIRACVEQGVDAFIVGDIGVLSIVKDIAPNIKTWASTYLASTNFETVDFLSELGFNRVILERQLTINEITEIAHKSKIEIEVFIHGAGCSNINGKCYLFHFDYPPLAQARNRIRGLHSPCMLPFKVCDASDEKILDDLPVMDAFTGCSICKLPELVRAGVSNFKIVGRDDWPIVQENTTRMYRELIDLIMSDHTEAFWKRVNELKTHFMISPSLSLLTLDDYYCQQERCFYSPLFHTPYRIPSSWCTWTKMQFKKLAVVE
ncbi:MAG: family peptidase [Thermoproteota archaeon]|nr:family peptidase [Thermoproteota archaeon]